MAEEGSLLDVFEAQDSDIVDIEMYCHDCKAPVRVRATKDGQGVVFEPCDGSAGYYPKLANGEHHYFVKCADCYEQAPRLGHFNPTEVYTRVVGYYRPVSAFNKGKIAEYKDRKWFVNPDEQEEGEGAD